MSVCCKSSLMLFAVLSLGIEPTEVNAQTSWPILKPTAEQRRVEAVLQRPVSEMFEEMPLKSLTHYITARFGIVLQLDYRALDDAGVSLKTTMPEFTVSEMKLGSVLEKMLRQVDLTWLMREGMVLITTPEEAENHLETRVYPVADLVVVRRTIRPGSRPYQMGSGRDAGNRWIDPDEWMDFDSLIYVITSTIAPDAWSDVGGPGSIESFAKSRVLVISQTRSVHEQVESLLEALRRGGNVQGLAVEAGIQSTRFPARHHATRSGPRRQTGTRETRTTPRQRTVYRYAPVSQFSTSRSRYIPPGGMSGMF